MTVVMVSGYWVEHTVYSALSETAPLSDVNALRKRSAFQLVWSVVGLCFCIVVSATGQPVASVVVFLAYGVVLIAIRAWSIACSCAFRAREAQPLIRREIEQRDIVHRANLEVRMRCWTCSAD